MRPASELIHPALLTIPRESGWKGFSLVQQQAFEAICCTNDDLIIGGATSSGKTEAAFFPLLSRAAERKAGISVLCISPTKALINDQHRRLMSMARRLNVPITMWHGDATQSGKINIIAKPRGILLMTPESLEGRFICQPRLISSHFSELDVIVIDEVHDFFEGARGHQLASLLARLDQRAERHIRKIGISATLGDRIYAQKWLSPVDPRSVRILDGDAGEILLLSRIRGYQAPAANGVPVGGRRLQALQKASLQSIADVILESHRRGTHIVFAGSKQTVETLVLGLNDRAASASLPERFRAHHGSMGKGERERVEEDLRLGKPLTAITTITLALGVDIGSVDSIDHIGAPRSLTSFRQQVGRSGRRDDPAVVTIHVTEEQPEYAFSLLDRLRLNTVRAVAALDLLKQRFVEPPEPDGTMLTVVLQQTLSFIQEHGGATLADLLRLMRSVTPFSRLAPRSYSELLVELCKPEAGLIFETKEGKYLLAKRGEKLIQSQEIFAAFQASKNWNVWSRQEQIGSLIRSMPICIGDTFFLAGKRWKAVRVEDRRNRVTVEPSSDGAAPFFNLGGAAPVHEQLACQMREVLACNRRIPDDCDAVAGKFLAEGRKAYKQDQLDRRLLIQDDDVCHLFTWKGTKFNALLAVLLRFKRFACDVSEIAVSCSSGSRADLVAALSEELPSVIELSQFLENLNVGKFDKWVPERLLREDWAKRHAHLESGLHSYCRAAAAEV